MLLNILFTICAQSQEEKHCWRQPVFDLFFYCQPVFDPMHRDIVAEHRVDDLGQLVRVVDCRVQRELLKDTRVKNFIEPSREKHRIEMF